MIGLFFIGMGATLIGALIVWWVINNFVIKDKKNNSKGRYDDLEQRGGKHDGCL